MICPLNVRKQYNSTYVAFIFLFRPCVPFHFRFGGGIHDIGGELYIVV